MIQSFFIVDIQIPLLHLKIEKDKSGMSIVRDSIIKEMIFILLLENYYSNYMINIKNLQR